MTWKYVAGDNYDLKQLRGLRDFFLSDVLSAQSDLIKANRYSKYGLPNWRNEILRRRMGVEEAQTNLNTIEKVITVVQRENR